MLDHVSIGVRDAAASKPFYDAALKPLGYSCISQSPGSLGYGARAIQLWVNDAGQLVPAEAESGLHFCFAAPTRASVDAFHAAALRQGGKDNGPPGLPTAYGDNYYAAFVIDPDGYRLEACCGRPE